MLNNRPIGARLTLIVAVMTAASALIVAVALYQLYTQLSAERQRHTRELVETAVSHLAALERAVAAGDIDERAAKARALREIAALRYDGWNYFWITDLRPALLAHPEAPDLVGKPVGDMIDSDGRALFREFIAAGGRPGGGFVYYKWPKPGAADPVRKLAYVRHFEPWGWVVGSGMYLDDIDAYALETALRLAVPAALAAGGALFMAWRVRRSIVRPLRQATRAMTRLAKGDDDVRLDGHDRPDEVGDLLRVMRAFKEAQDENRAMRRAIDEEARITGIVFNTIAEAVVVTDRENRISRVNPAFTRTTGFSAAEAVGQNPRMLRSGRHDAAFYQEMWAKIAAEGSWSGEIWNRRADGSIYPEALSIHAVRDETGAVTEHVAVFSDISERKDREMRMRRQAEHDALTGLPNRAAFEEQLAHTLHAARRHDTLTAVLFIDLDGFKEVNDTYGHAAGDEVLQVVAVRLRGAVRESDLVARLGGDEFTIILHPLRRAEDARVVADKVLSAVSAPCRLSETAAAGAAEIRLGAGIGVAFPADEQESTAALVRRADQAMYRAKSAGRSGVVVDQPVSACAAAK